MPVDWNDPKEIAREADVFQKLIFCLFGLYIWELFTTCDFEWSLITKRRRLRWPLTFFFLCRYCILFAFIGLIISFSVESEINCPSLYTFNSWVGNMAILTATTCLMLRGIALWERKLVVVIPFGILWLAHWALLYRGMFIVHAVWEPAAKTCVVSSTNPVLLKINIFYTMSFDFIILCTTAVALLRHNTRTGLWQLLFQDGLVYFIVSSTSNAVPAVLNSLNLNPIMNVIATVPAAAISAIAACRAVMRLIEFNSTEVFVHSTSTHGVNTSGVLDPQSKPSRYTLSRSRPQVHVTTEHITMSEFEGSTLATKGDEFSQRTSSDIDDALAKGINIKLSRSSSENFSNAV